MDFRTVRSSKKLVSYVYWLRNQEKSVQDAIFIEMYEHLDAHKQQELDIYPLLKPRRVEKSIPTLTRQHRRRRGS